MSDVTRRFKRLKAAVVDFIGTKDALALKDRVPGLSLLAQPREFEFRSDAGKLKAFNDWFRQQVEIDVFSVPPGTSPDEPWTAEYVESAYKRGQLNAYVAAKQVDGTIDASQAQFLRESFNQPEAMNKVRLLAQRAFEDLRGVTATMGSQMNSILAQGMIDGSSALEMAKQMSDRIDTLSFSRALTIARTETIRAHSEGQLDAYERLGIKELGLQVEWSTAGDDRVCPICAEREGKLYSVEEARGMIPIHPNCRCAFLPAVSHLLRR